MKNKTTISISNGLQDFTPVSRPFEELSELTCTYNYSPVVYEKNYRESKNFKYADLCVLDFDGNLSIAAAKEIFSEYRAIIVTTKSHQINFKNGKQIDKTDRFRVILQFDRTIVNLKEYEAVMTNIINQFDSDPACADGARFFYPNATQGIWISQGKKLIEVTKYNEPTRKSSFRTISSSHHRCGLDDDLEITDKNGHTLTATQWVEELQEAEDGVTHTVLCPNPEHDDKHPSAFITLSKYRKNELYVFCHKCGSIGTYPIQKLKLNRGKK